MAHAGIAVRAQLLGAHKCIATREKGTAQTHHARKVRNICKPPRVGMRLQRARDDRKPGDCKDTDRVRYVRVTSDPDNDGKVLKDIERVPHLISNERCNAAYWDGHLIWPITATALRQPPGGLLKSTWIAGCRQRSRGGGKSCIECAWHHWNWQESVGAISIKITAAAEFQ